MKVFIMKKKTSFTLVELVIVIIVLSVLFSIATISYIDVKRVFEEDLAKSNLQVMKSAVQLYRGQNNGELPLKLLSSPGKNDGLDYYLDDELNKILTAPNEPYKYSLEVFSDRLILTVKGPKTFNDSLVIMK